MAFFCDSNRQRRLIALRLTTVMPFVGLLALSACDNPMDWDLRNPTNGLSTTEAARQATLQRPQPDARGVLSYPTYQVAIARRGDTVASVAQRVGIPAQDLAQHNALTPETTLRADEVLALPSRVAAAPAPGGSADRIDITTLAGGAIARAEAGQTTGGAGAAQAQPAASQSREPTRHRVQRGETAFSIARLYNVTPRALADWNGLGPDMMIREGQYLLIPMADPTRPVQAAAVTAPGQGSATPPPPSAAQPLPQERTPTVTAAPSSPDLGSQRTAASSPARFAMPVQGSIIRAYQKGRNDGIDIGAPAGTPVTAAANGTVAAITRDTDQVPILVIRHTGNLLTVYANVDNIRVERGATVTRGQTIASVRAGSPSFVHFEIRDGIESVDPMTYLQ